MGGASRVGMITGKRVPLQGRSNPPHCATMKVLALAGSTSSTSINRQLAVYAAGLLPGSQVTALDLREFDAPIYSSDEEAANGIPASAKALLEQVQTHDAIVISLAEHNGSYAAAFKNLYDWCSRQEQAVWGNSDPPRVGHRQACRCRRVAAVPPNDGRIVHRGRELQLHPV